MISVIDELGHLGECMNVCFRVAVMIRERLRFADESIFVKRVCALI